MPHGNATKLSNIAENANITLVSSFTKMVSLLCPCCVPDEDTTDRPFTSALKSPTENFGARLGTTHKRHTTSSAVMTVPQKLLDRLSADNSRSTWTFRDCNKEVEVDIKTKNSELNVLSDINEKVKNAINLQLTILTKIGKYYAK